MSRLDDPALLIGRLLLASLFLFEGWSKITGYAAAAGYMQAFGVPGALLPMVVALEVGGGLMIAAGWRTRWVALAFAVFCVGAALLFHRNFASRGEVLHFEKDLALAGGFLVLFVAGAGRWSLDHRRTSMT